MRDPLQCREGSKICAGSQRCTKSDADKKIQDMIYDATPAPAMQLSNSSRTPHNRFRRALFPIRWVFDLPFHEKVEMLEVSGDDTCRCLCLVLSDAPYKKKCFQGHNNAVYERLYMNELDYLGDLFTQVMDLGAQGHMFSIIILFILWYNLLYVQLEVSDASENDEDEAETWKRKQSRSRLKHPLPRVYEQRLDILDPVWSGCCIRHLWKVQCFSAKRATLT